MNKILKFIFTFIFLTETISLQSREPYHTTISVGSESATVSAPNLVDLKRELKTTSLELIIPYYTPVTAVSLDFNLRGILALATFAEGSTTLVVDIPQAGTTQTFTGATRDDSLTLFKDYIRDGGTKHRLLRAYARFSPIDPIAGNPTSLMAEMGQSDYLVGRLSPLSGCDSCWSAQPIVHQFQGGIDAGRAFSDEFETTTIKLPIRYSYSPDLNWALVIDAPLTLNINGGAYSVVGSLGFGIRFPITNDWSLTPILRFGAGGSLDLCTAGDFVSAGLISTFNYKVSDFVLSMTNYAAYITSGNLWLTGVNFNYHLHNYVFKNGLSITSCNGFTVFGRPINYTAFFIDTDYERDHLFINHYDEVGIAFITTNLNPCIDYDCLSLGFSYQFGQKSYKGFYINLEYQF